MARIKSKNTSPEVKVRSLLHKLGYRFRLHDKKLPGKPDIILPKHKTVIFVHGCFWHHHKGCARASMPKTNQQYWQKKFKRNIERFDAVEKEITKLGWKVFVVWECETNEYNVLLERVNNIFYYGGHSVCID